MKAQHLSEIAALLGGKLIGQEDPVITGAAGIEDAGPNDLTFVARPKLLARLANCQAGGVLLAPGMESNLPAIEVANPYEAFATFLTGLQADPDRVFPPGVHPSAVVDESADVSAAASIGPFCVIGPGAVVGEGSRLGPHVTLGPDATVGRQCMVYAQVTIREHCVVGDRVIIHASACIGSDGFGYLPGESGLRKIPQVGVVIIEDDVELGAGVCVDRATTGQTVVGQGSKIDNQVQIGHNVRVGRHCAVSAQTGVSGSCVIGDGVTFGGQVGVGDHIKIGSGVRIGAKSGIAKDVPDGASVFGYPALEAVEAFRVVGSLRKLPGLLKRVSELEKKLGDRDPSQE